MQKNIKQNCAYSNIKQTNKKNKKTKKGWPIENNFFCFFFLFPSIKFKESSPKHILQVH